MWCQTLKKKDVVSKCVKIKTRKRSQTELINTYDIIDTIILTSIVCYFETSNNTYRYNYNIKCISVFLKFQTNPVYKI